MADNTRTSFPVMGDEGIINHVCNMSGKRSPYTMEQPKGNVPMADDLASGNGTRSQSMVGSETLGPCCSPQTTQFYPNAASHADSGKNTKILPSHAGTSDFWNQRL